MSDGRFLVTGVDAAGRSCAARDDQVTLGAALEGLRYAMMYTAPALPAISTGGGRAADTFDLGVAAGAMDWKVLDYAPGMEFSMHHTDTVDFDIVLSGSIELILDDGVHPTCGRRPRGGHGCRPRMAGGFGRLPDEHHFDWRFSYPAAGGLAITDGLNP